MTGTTAFITGVSVSALFVLSWLVSILYLRRRRKALQSSTAAQAGPAPSPAQPVESPDQLVTAAERSHSIDAWLARAAALPDGQEPRPAGPLAREQAKLEALAARHFPELAVPHPHLHLFGITGRRSGCWPGSAGTPACPTRSTPWMS